MSPTPAVTHRRGEEAFKTGPLYHLRDHHFLLLKDEILPPFQGDLLRIHGWECEGRGRGENSWTPRGTTARPMFQLEPSELPQALAPELQSHPSPEESGLAPD